MTHATNTFRFLTAAALLGGAVLLVGCESSASPVETTRVQQTAAPVQQSSPTAPPPVPGQITQTTTSPQAP